MDLLNVKKNKDIPNMNHSISFHKYTKPKELAKIKKIFPELSDKEICESLENHNYNIDTTIEDLLSLRFIKQTISSDEIIRNNKIMGIYSSNVEKPMQEVVFNEKNPAVLDNISNSYIKIPNKKCNPVVSTKPSENTNKSTPNNNCNNNDSVNVNDNISHNKKKKYRKRNSKKEKNDTNNETSDIINNKTDNKSNNKTNCKTNDEESSSAPSSPLPDLQSYFKVSEMKSMFPNISDRLLILTLQVNKGDIDEVVNFLLMHNNIKDDINEEDICRSLEMQLEKEYGNTVTCDGNCISQGYPCYLHSRLFITKEDDFNTLTLSEIMKIWNKFELRDRNINIGFSDQTQAVKYYTENNEEIEFSILNRIKEAEKAMTPEEQAHQDDVEYFRKREEQLKLRKHSFFSEASRKYRERNFTGYSSAAYYSEEGRQLTDEIEKVKLLAVSAQIRLNEKYYIQNNGLKSFCGVDLHGLTVKEAIAYLNDMLNIWKMEVTKYYSKNPKKNSTVNAIIHTTTETYDFKDAKSKSFSKIVSSAPKQQPEILYNVKINKIDSIKKKKTKCLYPRVFNIITGRGIHSDANIGARLKPSILNYLKNNKYNYVEINSGSIQVRI